MVERVERKDLATEVSEVRARLSELLDHLHDAELTRVEQYQSGLQDVGGVQQAGQVTGLSDSASGAFTYAAAQETVSAARAEAAWDTILADRDPLVRHTARQLVQRVPEIVHARRQALTEGNIEALVDVYLQSDPMAGPRRRLETDNARERARFLAEVPCLTSKELAEQAGHQAANASVTGSRWKQQRRVFSVPWKGQELYPAFQFREGRPHATLAKALRELPEHFSAWQTAFWFTSSNGWLRGAAPAERLDEEDAVVMAAQRENEPLTG